MRVSIAVCFDQADIVFVIDASGSINDNDPGNWNRIKNFLVAIVEQLEVRVRLHTRVLSPPQTKRRPLTALAI